jgi:TonB family protein
MTLAMLDRNLGAIWIELLRHLWQSALILAPLFLVAHVLRSAPARWTHRLWVAALAKLFIPLALFGPLVGVALDWALRGHPIATDAKSFQGFRVLVTVIGADTAKTASRVIDRLPAPFFALCTLTYLGIACWLIFRTGRDLVAACRLARAAVTIEGDRKTRLECAIRLAGVERHRVIVSDSNLIPAVVGALRPRIVLPLRLLDALDVDELKAVLLHEEMHRRNADPAIAVAQRLASSLLFFFPLLAPIQRRLRESAELRCDEDALAAGAEPRAYVRALARTIQLGLDPSPAPAALGDGNPSLVAARLVRLSNPWRTKLMTKHRVAIAVAAAILAVGVFLPVAPAPPKLADDVTMPVLLTKVEVKYPHDARDARAEGTVILQARIQEDGTVGDVEVAKPAEGWPSMDEAAIVAVRQRTYRPATTGGQPVSVDFDIKVEFRMK